MVVRAAHRRRAIRCSAALAAVVAAFAAGAVTAAASRPVSAAAPPGVLDDAARQIEQAAAEPVDPQTLQRAAVEGMLGTLHDPWSAYYGPSDFTAYQDGLSGSYSGVGLWVRSEHGRLVVTSVLPDSPAAAAGIAPNDELARIGGRAVDGDDADAAVRALRGTPGSAVTVGLRRGGRSWPVVLRRQQVERGDVSTDTVAPGIGRIAVRAFDRGTGERVKAALAGLLRGGARGVVLDLRGDPGGLVDEAVATASVFLDAGPVVSLSSRSGPARELDASPGGDTTTPLVVLVDGGTASAAEVVAGALQDRGRAVLVGAPTFGKGSVQRPLRLPDGSAVELTVAHYRTPSGRSLDGTGLRPDVDVPADDPPAAAVQRGVDVLDGLVADAAGIPPGSGG